MSRGLTVLVLALSPSYLASVVAPFLSASSREEPRTLVVFHNLIPWGYYYGGSKMPMYPHFAEPRLHAADAVSTHQVADASTLTPGYAQPSIDYTDWTTPRSYGQATLTHGYSALSEALWMPEKSSSSPAHARTSDATASSSEYVLVSSRSGTPAIPPPSSSHPSSGVTSYASAGLSSLGTNLSALPKAPKRKRSPEVKSEPAEPSATTFILEGEAAQRRSPSPDVVHSFPKVPLRAKQASREQRKMMDRFHVNPFALQGAEGTNVEEACPLEKEPLIFEWWLDGCGPASEDEDDDKSCDRNLSALDNLTPFSLGEDERDPKAKTPESPTTEDPLFANLPLVETEMPPVHSLPSHHLVSLPNPAQGHSLTGAERSSRPHPASYPYRRPFASESSLGDALGDSLKRQSTTPSPSVDSVRSESAQSGSPLNNFYVDSDGWTVPSIQSTGSPAWETVSPSSTMSTCQAVSYLDASGLPQVNLSPSTAFLGQRNSHATPSSASHPVRQGQIRSPDGHAGTQSKLVATAGASYSQPEPNAIFPPPSRHVEAQSSRDRSSTETIHSLKHLATPSSNSLSNNWSPIQPAMLQTPERRRGAPSQLPHRTRDQKPSRPTVPYARPPMDSERNYDTSSVDSGLVMHPRHAPSSAPLAYRQVGHYCNTFTGLQRPDPQIQYQTNRFATPAALYESMASGLNPFL